MFNKKKKKNHIHFNNLELLGLMYGLSSITIIAAKTIQYFKWKKCVKDTLDKVKVDVNIKKMNEPETETKPEAEAKKAQGIKAKEAVKKDTSQLLGIEAKKEENFSEWYSQVITRAELLDYYDVSGCYIIRPYAYALWETIQHYLDTGFKKIDVQNSYFPIFVPASALKKEEDELHGFEAEVAWVTKSGKSDLALPVAIRPTSETVMYPAFKNWITSHRDLPLKLNQWCNVVRWEFKHPVPFIRTREFLWQEGHTAHTTLAEADKEVYYILDLYASAYQDMLAVPVIKGIKTKKEQFAGALYTTTVEAYIPTNGRAVQAATSHSLGQNFAKIFDVQYLDENGNKQYIWQNSWGFTTRSIGIMIMVHGDDKGLVLPPRVAQYQAVIIPIVMKNSNVEEMNEQARKLCTTLREKGVRAMVDDGIRNPGWKFNHWEKMGVPLRIELGPKDMLNKSVVVVRRDTGVKEPVSWDNLADYSVAKLEEIQKNLFERAKAVRDSRIADAKTWPEFMSALNKKCICRVPWCNETSCEECIKERSAKETQSLSSDDVETGLTGAAKSLCIPLEHPELEKDAVCFACGKPAKVFCIFGRSY